MTKDQRAIAAGIDFLHKCHAAGLAMEAEYSERYGASAPDDDEPIDIECHRAWEAAIGDVVGFVCQCEKTLMRMTLLACGRTDGMLGNDDDVDVMGLKVLGACSIRTRDVIVTVACELADDDAHMLIVPIANVVEDKATGSAAEPIIPNHVGRFAASLN